MLDSKSGVEQKTYFLMNKIVTNIIQTILLILFFFYLLNYFNYSNYYLEFISFFISKYKF